MKDTKQSLSELWALLRNKEKEFGLDNLSLIEREIFQGILNLQGKNEKISLDIILKNCPHPRATFFRCFKKLRYEEIIEVTKDVNDSRKSFVNVKPKFLY